MERVHERCAGEQAEEPFAWTSHVSIHQPTCSSRVNVGEMAKAIAIPAQNGPPAVDRGALCISILDAML